MPSRTEFRAAQEHFGLAQAAAVEKDWHVVRALQAVIAVDASPFRLVFAGGTALARAHKLVQRMSEDVDLKIVLPDDVVLSGNQRRIQLGALRERITARLQAAGFAIDPQDEQQLQSRDANAYTCYQLSYVPLEGQGVQLRPRLQVELSFAPLRLPSVSLPLATFVTEAQGAAPEIPAIECVSVTETAAEKLVALTRRSAMVLAVPGTPGDITLVRHLYDLHMVREHVDQPRLIELARRIAQQDAQDFRHQYLAYLADIPGESRRGLLFWTQPGAGQHLYFNFVAAMVYGETADFSATLATLKDLVDATWPAVE